MGFLQLNGAQPSQKRPFRIMDLQDIWSAIGQIFAQKNDSEARIVSGFDRNDSLTEPGYSTAGVIAYKGDLYTYDPDNYGTLRLPGPLPSDPGAPDLYLAKFSTGDMRQLENGDIVTFSYLFVCGADRSRFTGAEELITLSNFVDKVESLKSYIGNGTVTTGKIGAQAVTTNKVADQAVTTNKIADQAVTNSKIGLSAVGYANLQQGLRLRELSPLTIEKTKASYSLSELVYPGGVASLHLPVATSSYSLTLNLMQTDDTWPVLLPLRISGMSEGDTIKFIVPSSIDDGTYTLTLPESIVEGPASTMLLCKYKGGYVPLGIY